MTPIERARAYVNKVLGAKSGDGGHGKTFSAAMTKSAFGLSNPKTFLVMAEWNRCCDPPRSDTDSIHIIRDAESAIPAKTRDDEKMEPRYSTSLYDSAFSYNLSTYPEKWKEVE